MTAIAEGPTDPSSPATPQVTDARVVQGRQPRGAVSDAGPAAVEVLGAPVLRPPLDRDTVQPGAVA